MKIIIKIGTSSLTSQDCGINRKLVEEVTRIVNILKQQGHQIVIISSGSIGLGAQRLEWLERPTDIISKQAAASIGQVLLSHLYQEYFKPFNIIIGQVLLTRRGMQDLERFQTARTTINQLLDLGVVPIVNENDVIADDEIRFSDNDYLGALVSEMVGADRLFILSDIDGLYTDNPFTNPKATLISEVHEITPEIEALATTPNAEGWGSGGMASKIEAAKLATQFGTHVHILNSNKAHSILDIVTNNSTDGTIGTVFSTDKSPVSVRMGWIAYAIASQGSITINDTGMQEIINNKTLNINNIINIFGEFTKGSAIEVIYDEQVIAKGISLYNTKDLARIIQSRIQNPTYNIEMILGYTYGNYIIHTNDLVILQDLL